MTVEPDTDAAIAFLYQHAPAGPWVLTAIAPDRRSIDTKTFHPATDAALREWLGRNNGQRNIYFQVNPPLRDLTKKAERADIAEVAWLHVDIDPRAGEDLADEQARALALLTERLREGVPSPTTIIFSGGGYQALWKLQDPIAVNGDVALGEEAARYNQQLETLFGADHCHNIDRILRLPGTVNLPDAKKLKKGRVPALASLIEFVGDRVYPRSDFAQAPARATATRHAPIAAARRVDDIEAFLRKYGLPDRVGVILVQGRHPDEVKKGDNSRSAWVFDAVCAMARARVPEEEMLGVLLDPEHGISESIRDKGNDAEGYALRQVERAMEKVAEEAQPELAELNALHAVLAQQGGKARVLCWERGELDGERAVPVLQSFEDFRNRYLNRVVAVQTEKGVVHRPLGDWWLKHPRRRQFLALRFLPGQPEEVDGYLNLWRGFGVPPVAGVWSLMRQHIREVLAASDAVADAYITRWAAWAAQNPGEAAEVALVFQGGRGTGKGTFARALKQLFGQHGLQVTSPGQLTGRFNAHMQDCCLLFADEAIAPGDKAAESVLKGLITEPELTIEGKGVNAVQTRNRLHIVMASNDEWVVPAGVDERRFAVFRVAETRKGDHDYFAALHGEIADGGLAAMLHDLLATDLAGWHPRREVPGTTALQQQKDLSLGPAEQFVLGILESGEIPAARHRGRPPFVLSNDDGRQPGIYTAMRRSSPRLREWSDQRLGKVLCEEWGCERRRNRLGQRGWAFPPLADMRARWDERYGPRRWDKLDDWLEACDADTPF